MNTDLKIVVAGPPQSGKSEIANIIAAITKEFKGDCKPTACLRILEFSATINVFDLQTNISAQLWDSSGDTKYSAAWPAIAYEADGVVLVYNAYDKNQGRQLEQYAKSFAKNATGVNCIVVAHKVGESDSKPVRPKLPKSLESAEVVIANAKEGLDDFLEHFNAFLGRVQQARVKRIEAKERELVGAPAPEPEPEPEPEPQTQQEPEVEAEKIAQDEDE